jgi:hypothetical protein
MNARLLSLLIALLCGAGAAHGQLNVRVSIKFILSAGGARPSNGGCFGANGVNLTSDQAVRDNIDLANDIMTSLGRGYRYQLTEIRDVSGWSGFFNISARSGANKSALEAVATSNATTRAQFFWRNDAINIYINNTSSGWCSFPGGDSVIFAGSCAYDTLLIHEMGHYFSLAHTHDGEQFLNSNGSSCAAGNCGCAQLIPGDDGFDDTLPDVNCWSRSQLAAGNPGASAAQLDNTFLNIMSYHIPQDRFTPDQLDAWTDTANSARFNAVSGRTRFVDRANVSGFEFGTSTLPYDTVSQGVAAASAGDIVLIRRGNYNQPQTITKAVTLRASRGNAIIGLP